VEGECSHHCAIPQCSLRIQNEFEFGKMLALLTVLPFHYSNNHAYERKELGNIKMKELLLFVIMAVSDCLFFKKMFLVLNVLVMATSS